ncbi:MAG: translesion DNA synthesis-associated protein ImuA [Herminiimonas sp.]|nr:translesion DNA synthesis-associated protein ImuA [Herminiimonas sp.]
MNPLLDNLCEQLAIWRCGAPAVRNASGMPSGFAALDAVLADNGWPTAALSELLTDKAGIGELSLLMPTLAQLSQTRGVLFIAPPFLPYAPALADAGIDLRRLLVVSGCNARDTLACTELALRSGACGAVVLWTAGLIDMPGRSAGHLALRRLHLAAQRGNTMALLLRDAQHAVQSSPAVLRIRLSTTNERLRQQLQLMVFKQRGLSAQQTVLLDPRSPRLQQEIMHPSAPPVWAPPTPHVPAFLKQLQGMSMPATLN